jgi:hypothetical protein
VAVSHKGIGVAAVFRETFSTASAYAEGFGGQEERKEPKAGMSISTEGNEGNKDWKQPSFRRSLRLLLLVSISCRPSSVTRYCGGWTKRRRRRKSLTTDEHRWTRMAGFIDFERM